MMIVVVKGVVLLLCLLLWRVFCVLCVVRSVVCVGSEYYYLCVCRSCVCVCVCACVVVLLCAIV